MRKGETVFEKIRGCEKPAELARALCDEMDDCNKCPVSGWCRLGRNGFNEWLEQKVRVG